jgi:hypothetical protein
MWGDLTDDEYGAEKSALQQQLEEIPDSEAGAVFDRHREPVRCP